MQSHSKLTRDKLPWTAQLANNILCIPPSRLPTTSTHMTSSLSSPCLIMDRLISTAGGEENKNLSAQPAACLESSSTSRSSSFSGGESEQQKSNLTWFLSFFFLFFFYLKQRLPNCTPAAGWTGSAGCLSRSCFHGNRWTNWTQALRETLSNAVYSPSFSEVMLNW